MAQLRLRHCCNYWASLAQAKLRGKHGGALRRYGGALRRYGGALQCALTLCGDGSGSRYVLMALGIDPLKNEANDVAMALGLDP